MCKDMDGIRGGGTVGKETGDQWEGKQKKFMLRRGGSRKKEWGEEIWKPKEREQQTQEEARPLVGVEFLGQKLSSEKNLRNAWSGIPVLNEQ